MTIEKQLGKRIKYLRIEKGWSQEELALESNINKNYISDLERGTRNPSVKILEKICIALDITFEVLFKGIQSF